MLTVAVLGIASGAAAAALRTPDPVTVEAVQSEVDALIRDFQSMRRDNDNKLASTCGLNMRLYTYHQRLASSRAYDQSAILKGRYAQQLARGVSANRAAYFRDPWNNPYWIRHYCSADKRSSSVMIYSFGPNRRRDSSAVERNGDDIAGYVLRSG